jgi:hypothetical protein
MVNRVVDRELDGKQGTGQGVGSVVDMPLTE